MKLRVVAVQLASRLGDVAWNTLRASRILRTLKPSPIPTVVVLPELALTGYAFPSPSAIEPFIEPCGHGRTADWARNIAKDYKAMVCVGYPENAGQHRYNAALIVDPEGHVVANYRKTHLYPSDEVWGCSESPDGFQCYNLPISCERRPFLRVQVGICMDLNPYKFTASFQAREFAQSVNANKPDLVMVPMAWLADDVGPLPDYWKLRLPTSIPTVYANRSGSDSDDVVYGGQSAIINQSKTVVAPPTGEGYLSTIIEI